jgi:hypothetical protein
MDGRRGESLQSVARVAASSGAEWAVAGAGVTAAADCAEDSASRAPMAPGETETETVMSVK